MAGVAYLHNLSIVHGDLKGVCAMFLTYLSPLKNEAVKHPRR